MSNPFDRQPSNEIVYHYTSIDALISILGKDCITLRATNCLYLNDSNEIIEGIDSIKRVDNNNNINELSFRNYYLTSFSKVKDKLEMWGMYAGNGLGISIGFHLDTIRKYYGCSARCNYGKEKIDSTLSNFLNISRLGTSVFFPSNGGKSEIIKHTSEDTDRLVNNQYIATCISSKNEAYSYEDEIRCFMHNSDLPIHFINRNGVVTPYVNVLACKDAVREIIIGPKNKDATSHKSIERFLEINEYNHVKIDYSKLPYRG